MRICPTCKATYTSRGRSVCPGCGTPLIDQTEAGGDPLIGTTLAKRFRIVGRVGTGGMGAVYRAEQAGLSRQVALKVLRRELILDRETVARFHREAKAMSMLLHANTVRVFDFGEDPATGHLFLAMELLEGELLTSRLEREGALPVLDAIEIVREILRSLAEAHSKGLIHRDLKPDNVFLANIAGHEAPVVKVLDFGIAKVFRKDLSFDQLETQAGTVFGTPRYMSPEQAQGKQLDPRSDLYAVGVLLYQLVSGRPPFLDDDAVVVMAKHIRERPVALRKVAAGRAIPAGLERIVMRALEKSPEARYSSAEALEQVLAECAAEIAKERAKQDERTTSPAIEAPPRRLPLWAGGAALLGAALVLLVWGAARGWGSTPTSQPTPPPALDAPPAPAAPEVARQVTLASEPPGAEVFRDGQPIGTAPVVLDLEAEDHGTLELRLEGHDPLLVDLGTLSEDETIPLVPTERAAPATRERRPARRRGAARSPSPATPPPSAEPYERFD